MTDRFSYQQKTEQLYSHVHLVSHMSMADNVIFSSQTQTAVVTAVKCCKQKSAFEIISLQLVVLADNENLNTSKVEMQF